jgi:hypothetical protein
MDSSRRDGSEYPPGCSIELQRRRFMSIFIFYLYIVIDQDETRRFILIILVR